MVGLLQSRKLSRIHGQQIKEYNNKPLFLDLITYDIDNSFLQTKVSAVTRSNIIYDILKD